MGRTPLRALKASVSPESAAVPEGQPWILRRPEMSRSGGTSIDSWAAPRTTKVPSIAKPPSAAAEFPDPAHPAHKVALAHKRQVLERFTALGREAKLRSPEALAEQLLLLMDGAWVAARIFGSKSPAARVAEAARALIAAHSAAARAS